MNSRRLVLLAILLLPAVTICSVAGAGPVVSPEVGPGSSRGVMGGWRARTGEVQGTAMGVISELVAKFARIRSLLIMIGDDNTSRRWRPRVKSPSLR